jgi:hypothetical protein
MKSLMIGFLVFVGNPAMSVCVSEVNRFEGVDFNYENKTTADLVFLGCRPVE